MPLTEREVGLLWRYHDWLARERYILCERTWPPHPGERRSGGGERGTTPGASPYTYQPVPAPELASLLARFMAHEAGGADQATGVGRQAPEDRDTKGEGNDGSEL